MGVCGDMRCVGVFGWQAFVGLIDVGGSEVVFSRWWGSQDVRRVLAAGRSIGVGRRGKRGSALPKSPVPPESIHCRTLRAAGTVDNSCV